MKITESLFLQRHGEKIEAALGCYDRLVITGTLLDVAYLAAVQHRLNERDLLRARRVCEPLREAVRENAEALAKEAGLEIATSFRRWRGAAASANSESVRERARWPAQKSVEVFR